MAEEMAGIARITAVFEPYFSASEGVNEKAMRCASNGVRDGITTAGRVPVQTPRVFIFVNTIYSAAVFRFFKQSLKNSSLDSTAAVVMITFVGVLCPVLRCLLVYGANVNVEKYAYRCSAPRRNQGSCYRWR